VEPTEAKKSSNVLTVVLVVAVLVALLLYSASRGLRTAPPSRWASTGLPMLELRVQFVDIEGQKIPPHLTRLGEEMAGATKGKSEGAEAGCPDLVGGDVSGGPPLTRKLKKQAQDCPKVATWIVKRHPIGFSLYFRDGGKALSWFEEDREIQDLFRTQFFQGLFHDLLHSASVRAEDLHLEGVEGAFLKRLFREAIQADAQLHYDVAHGKQGFVFSFVRDRCPFASRALPIIVRAMARSGYRISGLEEPILEMRVGLQRVFLTQDRERVYLANGLEALINGLESLRPPSGRLPETPLVVTMRGEAFVDKVLPVMLGSPTWEVDLGLGLSSEAPGALRFDTGKLSKHLRPGIFKGVLASIPHDAFAAVVTSFHFPPEMTIAEWQRLGRDGPQHGPEAGPQESGVAILWDLSSQGDAVSNVGVVIANPSAPDRAGAFEDYFEDNELTAQCAGGTVFLAATSRGLLLRMKESCERQSLSVLDWERGVRTKEYGRAQLFLFMNPGAGMKELFLAGGAKKGAPGGFAPKWKQQYELAKEAMRTDAEKVFGSLPILAYAGRCSPIAESVDLNGFTVRQGASR
jgi:hypothetical protein